MGGSLRFLSSLARLAPVPKELGLRVGGGAARLFGLLFLAFCLVFGVVALFGGDISAVTDWLDGHSALWDRAGTIAFKIFLGGVLLLCGATVVAQFTNAKEEKPGCLGVIFAMGIGYFCAVGLFM